MADQLTTAMWAMLCESGPDDITGKEGCGVELTTGALYATANALKKRGFGYVIGPGGPLPGMYWNNADGLCRRELELATPRPDKVG